MLESRKKIWIKSVAFGILLLLFLPQLSTVGAQMFFYKFQNRDWALRLNYRDAELASTLGHIYFHNRVYDLEKAKKAFKRAVAIEPGIMWGHYQLARIYFIGGDYESALEEINKELEFNPENLRSFYVRGLIYGYNGRLFQAEKDFERFTEWAPEEWAGYNDLAWILSKQAKYKEAKEVTLIAFKQVPDAENNPWLWNSLGVAQLNLEKYTQAKSSFENAKKLAAALTIWEWQNAYPGNNPNSIESGLLAFKEAIEKNLNMAVDKN